MVIFKNVSDTKSKKGYTLVTINLESYKKFKLIQISYHPNLAHIVIEKLPRQRLVG